MFVGKDRFTIAVCEAITQFNDGARSTQSLFEKLKISCGLNTAKALNFTNKKRLQNSRLKVSSKYRIQRQKLQSRRKNKGKDDTSYIPGAFSSHITPDISFTKVREKKNPKVNESINITFIHDDDVKVFVMKI